jgi:hypothetical protein
MNKKRRVMVQIMMRLYYYGELQQTIAMMRDEWQHISEHIEEINCQLTQQASSSSVNLVNTPSFQ